MKIKDFQGFRVAKCDVDEALGGTWRAAADGIDVVRISDPPRGSWPELRHAGFVCKPKLVRWYAPVCGDDEAYRSRLTDKDRWNLRRAERAAERAGLSTEVVGPIDAALLDEFLPLYHRRIAEMRYGLDIAGGLREELTGNDDFRAVVMREPDGSLAGAVFGRRSPGDGALRLNVSAVTERWRRGSLARVLYVRAASVARELGLPRVSTGTDPNLFGLIAKPGLYSFKVRLGYSPTAPQRYLPHEAAHEADLVLRLGRLSDPSLIVGYRTDTGDDDLVLHVLSDDPATDTRPYGPGLAHPPVIHPVGAQAPVEPVPG